MTPRRALVTGGNGYVGRPLIDRLLRDGHEVTVVDNGSRGRPRASWAGETALRVVIEDIREAASLAEIVEAADPHRVFHLAAIHFIPTCNADPAAAIDVNVTGTESVLQACRRAASLESVVLISSAAVYEPDLAAHTESSAVRPVDIYGFTKLWVEHLAQLYRAQTGIPTGLARLFNVFGPGETNPHLIPAIIEQAAADNVLRLGNLDTKRDYVYVDDVADALVRLSDSALVDGALTCNVGSEQARDGHAVVAAVGEILGRELTVETDEARMRRSDRPVLLSDCSLAREQMGWRPRTSFRDGLAVTLREPMADAPSVVA